MLDDIVQSIEDFFKEHEKKIDKEAKNFRSECCNARGERRKGISGDCWFCLKCQNIAPRTLTLKTKRFITACCRVPVESWKGETGAMLVCIGCGKIPDNLIEKVARVNPKP